MSYNLYFKLYLIDCFITFQTHNFLTTEKHDATDYTACAKLFFKTCPLDQFKLILASAELP